jgi:hypothetical protein
MAKQATKVEPQTKADAHKARVKSRQKALNASVLADEPVRNFVDADTAALRWAISRTRVYQLVAAGALEPPPVRVGALWLFHKDTKYMRNTYVKESLPMEPAPA